MTLEEKTKQAAELYAEELNSCFNNDFDGFVSGAEWERERDKWIDIREGLPPNDIAIWTCSKFGMRIGRLYSVSGNWSLDGVYSGSKIIVTHWQPLPEPPKVK